MWEIDRHLIGTFIARYGGVRGFRFSGRNITNKNDILDACRQIYITKHVLYKGRTQVNPQKWSLNNNRLATTQLEVLLSNLAEKIWNYFNLGPNTINNQHNFDVFHNELCKWFMHDLNVVRTMVGLPSATYGNVQKMINILFKYLICFDDYSRFADLFSYCHMPIDNYILGDFIHLGIPGIIIVPGEKQYVFGGVAQCWHEFDEEHYLNLLNDYRTAVGLIKHPDLSYMSVEFSWFSKTSLPVVGAHARSINRFHR